MAAPVPGRRKQDIAREHILGLPAGTTFRFSDLRRELPSISDATIRLALYDLRRDAAVTAQPKAPDAAPAGNATTDHHAAGAGVQKPVSPVHKRQGEQSSGKGRHS